MTTNILGTATVIAAPGSALRAHVEVLREINEMFYEVRVISGTGGWSRPGKVFGARKSIVVDFEPADLPEVEPAPVAPESDAITAGIEPISKAMDAEDYMNVLVERQQRWTQAHPEVRWPALLEWFILPGEEALVQLPEHVPAEKPARKPRVYRSAAELREKRDKLVARMERVARAGDVPDRAAANLSPFARSRPARNAGRRRFADMDRNLAEYAKLQRQVAVLDGQIARAEAREARTAG
jgi:hypothetical protein